MDLTNVSMKSRKSPKWRGPTEDGITQGMIRDFLSCRERFRVRMIEGLRHHDKFNHKFFYGSAFHLCDEYHAAGEDWKEKLWEYAEEEAKKYPFNQEEIDRWFNVCMVQFPVYVEYWKSMSQVGTRKSLLQEEVFDVPYKLPSGRVVRLRGRWDGVDLVTEGKELFIQLVESKTKGDIDEQAIQRQLRYDLQTQMYLIALGECRNSGLAEIDYALETRGVRYNVIRRPLSGGEGNIKQLKNETKTEYYERLRGVIDGTGGKRGGESYKGPSYWFMRWDVTITLDDIENFKRKSFDPILEQICDWYEFVTSCYSAEINRDNLYKSRDGIHFMQPFGVSDRGMDEIDYYIMNGDRTGLVGVSDLFPELSSKE